MFVVGRRLPAVGGWFGTSGTSYPLGLALGLGCWELIVGCWLPVVGGWFGGSGTSYPLGLALGLGS